MVIVNSLDLDRSIAVVRFILVVVVAVFHSFNFFSVLGSFCAVKHLKASACKILFLLPLLLMMMC